MEKQEEAFKELKERFTQKPNLDRKMRMEVNVLDYTTGGVLSMEGKDRR